MEKNRASAIIPYKNSLIVIKRIKGNSESRKEYYTIPGGGQEEGETIEEATLREIKEEIGIEIELTNKCYVLEFQGRKQYFFVAKYNSGQIGSGTGPEMTNLDYERYGAYIPEIISIEEIKNIKLLPEEIKNIIISDRDEIFGWKFNLSIIVQEVGWLFHLFLGLKTIKIEEMYQFLFSIFLKYQIISFLYSL